VQFAAFKQFCDDTTTSKQRAISKGEEAIEVLKADINKYVADAEQLTKEISQHDADVAAWTGDKKAAAKVREIEHGDYSALHTDYSESIDALRRAIAVLKQQAIDRPQSSLTQISKLKSLNLVPIEAKRAIDLFLQSSEDPLSVSAPEADAYEFQSHSIIETLEQLLDKFIDERTEAQKAEVNSRHAYEMLIQDLTAQTDQATTDRGEKAEVKAKKLQAKASGEGDLTDTTSTKEADEKYLTDLTGTCQQKSSDFETRQQLRTDELETIGKAIEILKSDTVSGHAEKYLPTLVQRVGTSLAHLRSGPESSHKQRAADFLRDQAHKLNSRVLSTLSLRVEDDPFGKVKKMIQDLIARLMDEANEEAEHKGWCDTELSTNEQTRKEKTRAVETLHAEIDQLEASISQLTEDISQLSTAIADLNAAMSEQTTLRQAEKEKNELTILDAGEAQTALAQALTVLKEFYTKAGDSTVLIQQQPTAPSIFGTPYTGMQSETGGVIGMLEVIESDFARLEAETSAAEATSAKEYDQFMTDSRVDVTAKGKDLEHKQTKKQDQSQSLTTKTGDLDGTQKELTAALTYYDKLKPSCVDSGTTYDERVNRRKEEIESLQEALRILNGEDIAA